MDGNFRAPGPVTWTEPPPGNGPGLFEINGNDPQRRHITNIRRLAGTPRHPGSVLIGCGGWFLGGLAAGLLYVSYTGQYTYIFAARHHSAESAVEAGMLDAGMIILSLLALGLARAGKPARTERALILTCAAGSALMNYAAADTASPRSVIAYTAAPIFLAIVVDRVIAVIRRHVRLDGEASPWVACGHAALTTIRLTGTTALYLLRFTLAAPSTAKGIRRAVLQAAPLPEDKPQLTPAIGEVPAEDDAAITKTDKFWELWQADPDKNKVPSYARQADITPGYARTILSRRSAK